jgi:hypothetical protein
MFGREGIICGHVCIWWSYLIHLDVRSFVGHVQALALQTESCRNEPGVGLVWMGGLYCERVVCGSCGGSRVCQESDKQWLIWVV